jgi:hypothetical protein
MLAPSDPLLRNKKMERKIQKKTECTQYPCPFNYLNQPTEILHFYLKSYFNSRAVDVTYNEGEKYKKD